MFSGRTNTSAFEQHSDDLSLHTADSTHNGSTTPSPTTLRTKLNVFINNFFNSTSTRHIRYQIHKYLFPTLKGFKKKSVFSKISSILSVPIIFLLATTLPVVKESALSANSTVQLNDDTAELLQDYDDDEDQQNDILMNNEDASWLKWLTAVQLIGGPMLVSFVLISQDVFSAVIVLPIALSVGSSVTVAFWLTTSATKQPRLYWMMCFVGFGIAVVWIFLIANEVVSVLQAIGMAVGVSEAILGLTIFALGNSLGDFVANVTMARMGYPLMAMSACFGGPMLSKFCIHQNAT
jgi:sodium/potassium/calcium exchanger 6